MRILVITITMCVFCVGCGVKEEPKYQTKNNYNKIVNII